MDESKFVQRDGRVNVRDIDKGVKNKFVWSWMDEKDESGQYFSDYIRKVKEAGMAFCLTCKEKINYSSNGKKSLYGHAKKTAHVKARNALKQTQSLPAVMMATKALESCIPLPQESKVSSLPYGTSSSIADFFKKSYPQSPLPPKPEPVPVGLADRRSHQEALICSFIAEHDLPLSIAPSLVSLAQELSKDPKSLNELKLDRSSATYKLKYGVHLTLRKRLLHQMRNNPFSFNVDESTSKSSKKRVLNVLVCYFNEEKGESITDLYCSLEMTTVNAKTVHAAIMGQLEADGIPLSNLMSLLSDSAAYMRGKHNGVQALLKGTASHLADVGGDTCHTIHNAVKSFCSAFDKVNFLPQLLDDIYNDFHYSADLREELRILSENLDLPYLQPLERISHRWLSIYDTTERLHAIHRQLILFYFAFLSKSDQTLYQDFTVDILKHCNKNAREHIKSSIRRLQSKSTRLTKAGKERKQRIVQKLFYKHQMVFLHLNTIRDIMPMFKSFVLVFEQKCPMIHKLHDMMLDTLRSFLSSFMKIEQLKESKLHKLDVTDIKLHLPLDAIFTGNLVKEKLGEMPSEERNQFLHQLKAAYIICGKYLQEKLPVTNNLLRALSSLDPVAHGHSITQHEMENLISYFPSMISTSDEESIKSEIKLYHLSKEIPPFSPKTDRLDHWWASVLPKFPALKPLLKASLSLFTGPRVEQSFSMMNNIISSNTNRMAIETYSAYQAVKYHLINEQKSAVALFKRDDIVFQPVDKSLTLHIQTAWQRSKQKSSKIRTGIEAGNMVSAHNKCTQQTIAIEENAKKRCPDSESSDFSLAGANAPKRQKH